MRILDLHIREFSSEFAEYLLFTFTIDSHILNHWISIALTFKHEFTSSFKRSFNGIQFNSNSIHILSRMNMKIEK